MVEVLLKFQIEGLDELLNALLLYYFGFALNVGLGGCAFEAAAEVVRLEFQLSQEGSHLLKYNTYDVNVELVIVGLLIHNKAKVELKASSFVVDIFYVAGKTDQVLRL